MFHVSTANHFTFLLGALFLSPAHSIAGTANRCLFRLLNPSAELITLGKTSDSDPRILDAFSARPHLDGSVVIPPHISISVGIKGPKYDKQYNVFCITGSIRMQNKKLRELMRDLKRRATPDNRKEVEYGAVIIEYQDGDFKILKHTSNAWRIKAEDLNKALTHSRAALGIRTVNRILHQHSPSPIRQHRSDHT